MLKNHNVWSQEIINTSLAVTHWRRSANTNFGLVIYELSSCLLVLRSLSSSSRCLILSIKASLSSRALWLACQRASSIFLSYQRSICRVTASKKYCVTSSVPPLDICVSCLVFALCWELFFLWSGRDLVFTSESCASFCALWGSLHARERRLGRTIHADWFSDCCLSSSQTKKKNLEDCYKYHRLVNKKINFLWKTFWLCVFETDRQRWRCASYLITRPPQSHSNRRIRRQHMSLWLQSRPPLSHPTGLIDCSELRPRQHDDHNLVRMSSCVM